MLAPGPDGTFAREQAIAIADAYHTRFGPDPARMPLQALVFEATRPA